VKEALFYRQGRERAVLCGLCSHHCVIEDGRRGLCGVRENRGGILYSLNYGKIAAEHLDPVEKKPLFHLLPGSLTYSLATVGCNFSCLHCQNHTLSQSGTQVEQFPHAQRTPAQIVETALRAGAGSLSFTYSEPTVFYEFAADCCRLAHDNGLKTIFVSNGYMSRSAATALCDLVDGINIDVKAYSEKFYHQICGGRLAQVLDNVRYFFDHGVWVEVTTLVIPGLNDSDEELGAIARFLATIDHQLPWHVSAFRPIFQMLDRPATPPMKLHSARDIGQSAGLKHVYTGNIPGSGGENTCCPGCGNTVIKRRGYMIVEHLMKQGNCPACDTKVAGVWE
jgi:pyruvate formate lyase activating enzyme